MNIQAMLAAEFRVRPAQVESVVKLIDEGNTIPFIARYRKEQHGACDMSERLVALRKLDARRAEIEKALTEQGVLTDELTQKLAAAKTLSEMEDIYRPFRPKRRTRATIAREHGLEPLSTLILLQQPFRGTLAEQAEKFVSEEKGVPDAEAALAGARDLIAEALSDDADKRRRLR